jgi:hypothetical protein
VGLIQAVSQRVAIYATITPRLGKSTTYTPAVQPAKFIQRPSTRDLGRPALLRLSGSGEELERHWIKETSLRSHIGDKIHPLLIPRPTLFSRRIYHDLRAVQLAREAFPEFTRKDEYLLRILIQTVDAVVHAWTKTDPR